MIDGEGLGEESFYIEEIIEESEEESDDFDHTPNQLKDIQPGETYKKWISYLRFKIVNFKFKNLHQSSQPYK